MWLLERCICQFRLDCLHLQHLRGAGCCYQTKLELWLRHLRLPLNQLRISLLCLLWQGLLLLRQDQDQTAGFAHQQVLLHTSTQSQYYLRQLTAYVRVVQVVVPLAAVVISLLRPVRILQETQAPPAHQQSRVFHQPHL